MVNLNLVPQADLPRAACGDFVLSVVSRQ